LIQQSRCGIPDLFELLGDVLALPKPAVGLGSRGAEQSAQIIGKIFNRAVAWTPTSLRHESSDYDSVDATPKAR
jgi:hypothetical protein